MNHEDERGVDAVFAALANPQRRAIVDLLALQPASISQVAEHVGMSLTAINRHLTVLEDSGLIQRRKHGRTTFLTIRRRALVLIQNWTNRFTPTWGTDEETLDNYIRALSRSATNEPT